MTLAIPIAPTRSDTPPRSRKSALRSFFTAPRRSRGSGGAATFSRRGFAGLSATGAWRAMRSTAPMRVSTCASAGAARPNSRRAVPSGMITAPSIVACRRTADEQADDDVEAVADEDRRLLVDPRDADATGGVRPRMTTRSPRASARRRRSGPAESRRGRPGRGPGDAAFIGSCVAPAASGSLIGTERTSVAAHVDVGERPGGDHAVEPAQARLGVPRQDRGAGAAGADRRADDDVRRLERVEVADDLVAGRLRQPERRDEGADADDGAEHGEGDTGRAARAGPATPRRGGRARPCAGRVDLGRRAITPPR